VTGAVAETDGPHCCARHVSGGKTPPNPFGSQQIAFPRPGSWITGHITSLFHNLVFDVNNSTCEATAPIEAHCK